MNRYLEKIAGQQEPIGEILHDHDERYYEIEDALNDHADDFDHIKRLYDHDAPPDPRRDRMIEEIRLMREHRLRKELNIDEQHHENSLVTAKRLMAIKGMDHVVNDDNASMIVQRFEQAHGSNHTNPSAVWKGLGVAAGAIGGAVLGGVLVRSQVGHSPLTLGGAIGGAIVGGSSTNSALSGMLNDRIAARNHANYEAREDAIESAYKRLQSRFNQGH